MDATLLLCDHAAVAEGKLYINGGCWSQTRALFPVTMGLAIYIQIPWDQTNRPIPFRIRLVNEDGVDFTNNEGEPIGGDGNLEVGRPPGLRQGVALDAPIALVFTNLELPPGGYRWELTLRDEVAATASFQAKEFPNG